MKKTEKQNAKLKEPKANTHSKKTYDGHIPSIIGKRRILVSGNPRGGFHYVDNNPDAVKRVKARLGKTFIRDLGVVLNDVRP